MATVKYRMWNLNTSASVAFTSNACNEGMTLQMFSYRLFP